MQYGILNKSQQKEFDLKQSRNIRKHTFIVWIEGFGDTTEHIIDIEAEVGIESPRGNLNINIGRATLRANNKDEYFYSNGSSKIKKNSRIKIWAGFDNLTIPIFTGVVYSVKPIGTSRIVIIDCQDYMGLFLDIYVSGSQYPNNTPKLILENFCSRIGEYANIKDTNETTMVYEQPRFDGHSILTAIEKICFSIFYVAYFDEDGTLQFCEREYSNKTDWVFSDDNVCNCDVLSCDEIINDLTIEYRDGFYTRVLDQVSINEYKLRNKVIRNTLFNSDLVSQYVNGSREKEIGYSYEGFKFESSYNSSIIDCVQIKMRGVSAHGNISLLIYSDNEGYPSEMLGISQSKAAGTLSENFTWISFRFDKPINITPLTKYWCIVNVSSVNNGKVYFQISGAEALGLYTYYNSGSWYTEDNKSVLHIIRGSKESQRVGQDILRFYKIPQERVKVVAPAVPQLQLMDCVFMDIKTIGIIGRYVIERRRHVLTSDKYITIDTLRKINNG
ncbi:MAG: hypothetical protein ACUVWN_11910 [bacterium]